MVQTWSRNTPESGGNETLGVYRVAVRLGIPPGILSPSCFRTNLASEGSFWFSKTNALHAAESGVKEGQPQLSG